MLTEDGRRAADRTVESIKEYLEDEYGATVTRNNVQYGRSVNVEMDFTIPHYKLPADNDAPGE